MKRRKLVNDEENMSAGQENLTTFEEKPMEK